MRNSTDRLLRIIDSATFLFLSMMWLHYGLTKVEPLFSYDPDLNFFICILHCLPWLWLMWESVKTLDHNSLTEIFYEYKPL